MLIKRIDSFYNELAIIFYRNAGKHQRWNEMLSLSFTDISTLDVVYLLKRPTYKELSEFLNISAPNANYRISKLIKKGYLRREQDQVDKRRYFLNVTEKYMEHYCHSGAVIQDIVQNVGERLSQEEQKEFARLFGILIEEMKKTSKL